MSEQCRGSNRSTPAHGEPATRAHPEPASELRDPYELDRHRIIESTAFRRLEHKTQVFAAEHHDHFRTRLTHTLEVAQIARTLARRLHANEDLAEAIALAHDLGHPPFGHAGESALAACLEGQGGFNHNLHSLRVVEFLEHPFPAFRGLNLTRATREGLAQHETQFDVPDGENGSECLGLSLEAAIASLADRIAFSCHDLEDAIGAGFLDLPALHEVTLWREALAQVQDEQGLQQVPHVHAVRRPVLDAMLARLLIAVTEGARNGSDGADSLRIPAGEEALLAQLETFLFRRVYGHPEVRAMDEKGRRMVAELFAALEANPSELPPRFQSRIAAQGLAGVVRDYIAGMTDRYCEVAWRKYSTSA